MSSQHRPAGKHLLADLHGVAAPLLQDAERMEALLREAAQAAGAIVLHSHFHSFGPGQGVTGVVLLAESHISIHTWPEHGFAAADIFMCGDADPDRALRVIRAALQPRERDVRLLERSARYNLRSA